MNIAFLQTGKLVSTLALVASLSACATKNDATFGTFFREAGSSLDGGEFGNATANNMLVQTGQRDFAVSLSNRFAAEVPNMINFDFDSAQLDESARAVLRQQAQWIRQFPEVRFRVYGHTDAVGSAAYNKALGLRRARAAVNYLATQGISKSRLEALASYGETQPLVPTQERERRNRRTVTEVSGFVQSHPNVLDGKYAQIIYRDYVASGVSRTTLTGVENARAASE